MNVMNSILVNAIAALTLSSPVFAADAKEPSTTATCRKAYGVKVVDGKSLGMIVAPVDLLIRGDMAKKAYAVGEVAAEPIRLEGREIAAKRPGFRMEGFSLLNRWFKASKHPADGIWIELTFEDVPREAKQIDRIEGTVQVLTGGDEKKGVIKNVLSRKLGPIKSPALQAAGIRASFYREEFPPRDLVYVGIEFDIDDREKLADLRLIQTSGPVSNETPQFTFAEKTFMCGYSGKKADLAKAELLIFVRVGGEVKTIPFKAENIEIK